MPSTAASLSARLATRHVALVAGCFAMLLAAIPAAAQSTRPSPASSLPVTPSLEPTTATITLYVGEAHVLNERDVRRMAVGNGKVIQATALDDRQVLVLPEAPGQSTLVLWGKSGPEKRFVFNVMAADTGRLLAEVQSMLGDAPRVSARIVGDKVVLEGSEVSEALSGRIGEIGKRFPQVVNLLPRIGMERMIAMDVKFVEIRRELLQDIGIKWNASAQGPSFQVIASSLASMINLLVQNGDAVILAEPRLSCRSGGSARFIAGGELPIPITGALGTASVAFKEYGIKFDVNPVASETGVIAARVATEISSINFEIAVKQIPGLTKRRAETDVNLRENETLVIAGLLSEEGTRNMDRVAGASELPVLGPLFRSRQFRDRQTDLVVFITPRFVTGGPMPPEGAAIGPTQMPEPMRLLPRKDPVPMPLPWEDTPRPQAAPATVPAPIPTPLDTTGEDRGTPTRYRASRERLRMVD
jgi:Flp pilus assembly secretin CpaC